MSISRWPLPTVTALVLAACGQGAPVTTSEPVIRTEASGAQRVTLAVGQSAAFGATNPLRVTFRAIESDSRCPTDVQCVWAGDAAVLLRLERGDPRAGTTLHTELAPKQIAFDDRYTIRLLDVTPHPRQGQPVAPGAYRVTIEVTQP